MTCNVQASRPILIYGAGIQGCREEAIKFAERCGYPVCLTWGAADLLPHDHPLRVGTFGTHGNRHANFAIQNADYILCIGSRLDTKATGAPVSSFAPKARVILMVDVDQTEIDKMHELNRSVLGIVSDAKTYFADMERNPSQGSYPNWLATIDQWRNRYPQVTDEHRKQQTVSPYAFVESLSGALRSDDVIVTDTGCVLGWMMQAFKFTGQRFVHAFNQTPMGYGLPAAVGAAFATGGRVVLVTGDGGLAVNITEFATVARHSLPIKTILFNNRGHAMCRQTQRQWLGGEYPATSYEGGLACPEYSRIAQAYGIESFSTPWADSAIHGLRQMMENNEPRLLELHIDPQAGIAPQVRFGASLEDGDPRLPPEELEEMRKLAA